MFGMMSDSGGGGGAGKRMKQPSGQVSPTESGQFREIGPLPVVLTVGTILKLAAVIVVPLFSIISLGLYHYHKTNLHMDDSSVHLAHGERFELETHKEAIEARKKLDTSIKRELQLRSREIKQEVILEQRSQINKLGIELNQEQKVRFKQLIGEVRQTRKEMHR